MDKVGYEVIDHVGVVTLNRAEKLNAMDADVFRLLREIGAEAGKDPRARAILVKAEGKSFSAGIDLAFLAGGLNLAGPPSVSDIASLQDSFNVFEEAPKPVVAAIQGHCLGAGLQLALACDLRIASTDAGFSAMEVRWGIIPDLGGTERLPRLVGLGRAKDMLLTGRVVGAEEALGWGLTNSVCDSQTLHKEAIELATRLAYGPPLALAAAKDLANGALDRTVSEGLRREIDAQRSLVATEDFKEAIQAGISKRKPEFKGN
ncbi:MAG: enoyl-CoA hydratase/isomerase family protein [Actinomycetota bacterium]